MAGFTHLHVHTEYSLLDGSGKIKEMISRAKELGMDSLAITDHGVMYGVIDFYEAAKEEGIKPILGCEVYVAPGSRFDKESGMSESRYNHLILLAENNIGYANLMKIVSIGFIDGFYYKPRVDMEILEKYHEGIIALSACLAGSVPRALLMRQYDKAKEEALKLQNIFGKNNFFLELQDHGLAEQRYVNADLIRMSEELGIDLVCTNDVHYIHDSDAQSHDILLCIQTGKTVHDENRMRYEGGQFYLKSEEEMRELFSYVPQAIENTKNIADRCNVTIEFGVTKLPRYAQPKEFNDAWDYFKYLCLKGLSERYKLDERSDRKDLEDRMNYEMDVIHSMGYVDYFLIVWDYVNYAKEHDIPVGPGRGSAAGSIVSYCLGITDLDPIKYNLIFERFLNPERVSMPDIDMDFCYEGRQQVIDYVVEKYGYECVSQIITFGTMAARAAIKDVGRALDIPYAQVDEVAKMVPRAIGMTIDKAIKYNPDLEEVYNNNSEIHDLIETAKRLEGLPRHSSVHAAGVLICDRPVDDYVPVSIGANGESVASFTMTTLEHLGLLKMDFLGLRTLTVIKDAEKLIRKRVPDFSIEEVDITDKGVYEYISTGKCDGIFQLESSGMKNFMKELKPGNIEDLIAGISLYRPGPMEFIPQYIKGKNNPKEVTYLCPELVTILTPTYGCIVYQEQVMQIVRDLAGYSWGRSDLVRRAMSKKKAEVINKERNNFIYGIEEDGVPGCIKNGISEEIAGKIYDSILDFANYAFNKSHAACYAIVSYRTAYLKTYYPVEFMAALMTSVIDDSDKVAGYIYTCKQMGINILPPDVNKSEEGFSVDNGAIRFGLSAIKALGRPTIKAIVEDRKLAGDFKSMNDFVRRMSGVLNKRALENIIKAGTLDSFGDTRRAMTSAAPEMLDNALKKSKDEMSGQMSLFDMLSGGGESDTNELDTKVKSMEEFDKKDCLDFEKEVLGVYVSGHPLDEDMNIWKTRTSAVSTDFEVDIETEECKVEDQNSYVVGGIINEVKTIMTKKGKMMAFVTIEDLVGTLEIVVFTKIYDSNRKRLLVGERVFITGRASVDANGSAKLLAEKVITFDESPKKLWIRLKDKESYQMEMPRICSLLNSDEEGQDSVIIYMEAEKQLDKWPDSKKIRAGRDLVQKLRHIYGERNIELT